MDKTGWNTGRQFTNSEFSSRNSENGPRIDDQGQKDEGRRSGEDRRSGDMEFWKSVLSNSHLRSRFIRDLEVQSISSRSTEDLALRHREEEILPRGASRVL